MSSSVQIFKSKLNSIKDDRRSNITHITQLAHTDVNIVADVVRILCGYIRQRPMHLKLVGFYMLDSIIKNKSNATSEFRRLFAERIVGIFADTFKKADNKTRHRLQKCRSTWQTIMPSDALYHLDKVVCEIESGCPTTRSEPATPPATSTHGKRRFTNENSTFDAPLPKRPYVDPHNNAMVNTLPVPLKECNNNVNQVKKPVTPNVMALLQEIKASGIFEKIKTPPSPKNTVTDDLFSSDKLTRRNPAAIEALHAPRQACHHCGIAFSDQKSEAFRRHVDTHVQQLLLAKTNKASASTSWYMQPNTWLAYDELAEVQKDPSQEAAKVVGDTTDADISNGGASPSDAISTSSPNKNCAACHEKFVEYFDDDEDEWRFKDGVVSNGLAVHRSCLEQMGDRFFSAIKN